MKLVEDSILINGTSVTPRADLVDVPLPDIKVGDSNTIEFHVGIQSVSKGYTFNLIPLIQYQFTPY
jgi:hypothetical protein